MYMCCQSIQSFVLFGFNKPSILWFSLSTVSWLDYSVLLYCLLARWLVVGWEVLGTTSPCAPVHPKVWQLLVRNPAKQSLP